ncbi:MAG: hypothetical protein U1F43_19440 [Myxococcota bacterium]
MTLALALAVTALSAAPPPPPAADACLVAGKPRHLSALVVHPGAHDSFELDLDNVPVEVSFGAPGDAVVHVKAPFVFDATLPRATLPLRVKAAQALADGRIGLAPKTPLVAGDLLDAGLSVTPSPGPLVHIDAVLVACDRLTFGDATAQAPHIVRPPIPRRMVPDEDLVELRAKPDTALPTVLVKLDSGAPFILERLGAKDVWTKVIARWSDGTFVRGWVETRNVTPFALDYLEPDYGMRGGLCGYGVSDTYHGPALVHGGAAVYDREEDGVVWARAASAVHVVVVGDSGMVAVTEIPGLGYGNGCRFDHAFVRAEDLTFPR